MKCNFVLNQMYIVIIGRYTSFPTYTT